MASLDRSVTREGLFRALTKVVLVGSILLSQACTEERSLKDLEEYKRTFRARIHSELPPLPRQTNVESYKYSASSSESPFSEKNVISTIQLSPAEDAVFPNQDRVREPLEFYALDTLKMVGTLKRDNRIYAIVLTSEGAAHRVSVGEYMGTDLGDITGISDGEITLEETVRIKRGRWEKRQTSIALIE